MIGRKPMHRLGAAALIAVAACAIACAQPFTLIDFDDQEAMAAREGIRVTRERRDIHVAVRALPRRWFAPLAAGVKAPAPIGSAEDPEKKAALRCRPEGAGAHSCGALLPG